MESDLEEGEIKDDTEVTKTGRIQRKQKSAVPSSEAEKHKGSPRRPSTPRIRGRFDRKLNSESTSVERNKQGKYVHQSKVSSRNSGKTTSGSETNSGARSGKKGARRQVEAVENTSSHSLNARLIIRVNNDKQSCSTKGNCGKENSSTKGRNEISTIPLLSSSKSDSASFKELLPPPITVTDTSFKTVINRVNKTNDGSRIDDISDVSDQSDDDDNRSVISLELPSKVAPELITIDSSDTESAVDEDVEELQLRRIALQDLMTRLNEEVKNISETEGNDSIVCDEDEEPYSPFDEDNTDRNVMSANENTLQEKGSQSILTQPVESASIAHLSLTLPSENPVSVSNHVLTNGRDAQHNVGAGSIPPVNNSFLGTYGPAAFLGNTQFYTGHLYIPPLGAGDVDMRLNNFSGNSALTHANTLPYLPVIPPNPYQHNQRLTVDASSINPFIVTNNLLSSVDVFSRTHPVHEFNTPSTTVNTGEFAFVPTVPSVASVTPNSNSNVSFTDSNIVVPTDHLRWPVVSMRGASQLGETTLPVQVLPPLPPPLPEVILPPLPAQPPPIDNLISTPNQSMSSVFETTEKSSMLRPYSCDSVHGTDDLSSIQSTAKETKHNDTDERGIVLSSSNTENKPLHSSSVKTNNEVVCNKLHSSETLSTRSTDSITSKCVQHKSASPGVKSTNGGSRTHHKAHVSSSQRPSPSKRRESSTHSDKSGYSRSARRGAHKSDASDYSNARRRKRRNPSSSPSRRMKTSRSERSVPQRHSSPELSRTAENIKANTDKCEQLPLHSPSSVSTKPTEHNVISQSVVTETALSSLEPNIVISVSNEKAVQAVGQSSTDTSHVSTPVGLNSPTDVLNSIDSIADDEEILRAQLLLDIARKKNISLPTVSAPSTFSSIVTTIKSSVPYVSSVNSDHQQMSSILTSSTTTSSLLALENSDRQSGLQSVSNPRSRNRQIVRVVNTGGHSLPGGNLNLKKTIINNNVHSKANLHSIQRTVVNTNLLKKNVYNQNSDPVMRHLKITVPNTKTVTPLIIPLGRDESSSEDEEKKQAESPKESSSTCKNVSAKTNSAAPIKNQSKGLPKDFEASLDDLLKASRQQTGKVLVSSKTSSAPMALKHLPPGKRAEYIRLKAQLQDYERKIKRKLERSKQGLENSFPVHRSTNTTLKTTNLVALKSTSTLPLPKTDALKLVPAASFRANGLKPKDTTKSQVNSVLCPLDPQLNRSLQTVSLAKSNSMISSTSQRDISVPLEPNNDGVNPDVHSKMISSAIAPPSTSGGSSSRSDLSTHLTNHTKYLTANSVTDEDRPTDAVVLEERDNMDTATTVVSISNQTAAIILMEADTQNCATESSTDMSQRPYDGQTKLTRDKNCDRAILKVNVVGAQGSMDSENTSKLIGKRFVLEGNEENSSISSPAILNSNSALKSDGKENTLSSLGMNQANENREDSGREEVIVNILKEDNTSPESVHVSKPKLQQFRVVDVVKEREELYLREKLLKAALLKKMEASNDRLVLRKIESDIISSRRSINRELTSLLSEMVHMSDLKVILKGRQDKVNMLREQLYSAETKLNATAGKLQVHERKRKDLTTRVFAMRKECVSLTKKCKQQGSKIEGSKYKIPPTEALEMKTKLIEVRNQNLVFQRENLKQTMSPRKLSLQQLPAHHLLSRTYRRLVNPSATLAAANRVKKSFHSGLKGKRASITSHIISLHGTANSKGKLTSTSQQNNWNPRRIAAGRQLKKYKVSNKGHNSAWLTRHDASDDEWDDQSVFLLPKILFKDVMVNDEPPTKKPYVQKPVIPFRVYESPLDSIREQNQLSDSSPCVVRNVDPFVTLCYFELLGMCSSTKCPFQHLYRPSRKVANTK